ncbi:MAG: hypothetical protein KU37_06375 [Sulfuricurvum sp. PC08-66]|nr:MAG: hypothetical protein KU37_06375 [Sulfuricurvum sp. PC08-66]
MNSKILYTKNNAITDSKNGLYSLGAMRLQDMLLDYYKDEVDGFKISISELTEKLGLKGNNDYMKRIELWAEELTRPVAVRNYIDRQGKEVTWAIAQFIIEPKIIKETHKSNFLVGRFGDNFKDYIKATEHYTKLDRNVHHTLDSKYSYKLYEMYRRYYRLPNKVMKNYHYVSFSLEELNEKLGTKYTAPSDMLRGLKRGSEEILEKAGIDIYVAWFKKDKEFHIGWEYKALESTSIIPQERVDELVDWVIQSIKNPIDNMKAYKIEIAKKIRNNTLDGLEQFYRGMLQHKYGMTEEEIEATKEGDKYKNFVNKIRQTLFD